MMNAWSEGVARMPVRSVVLALFLLQPWPLPASGQSLDLRVSPVTALAPADVHVRVVIDRDAGNRQIRVNIESALYFRSSTIELEGERAPRITELAFKGLPAGEYELRVQVLDSSGNERAKARRSVSLF
jgi:hypothetical protein